MVNSRIKISSIVQNQVPDFVREDYPLFTDFLKQYYISLESKGSVLDLLQNIDQYIKIDNLTNLVESTVTLSSVSFFDDTIPVNSTAGFPNSYGLLQIGDEIITYTSKTDTSFTGCIRGFSGVTSYESTNVPDELVFSQSSASEHDSNSEVVNLSILFLKEFLFKVKKQVTPGFEGRDFYSGLNENLFIKQSRDFYRSKGTEESFKILFRALYGQEIQVIKPSDYLLKASDAQYRVTKDLVVEAISGNPLNLLNRTLFQDKKDNFESASGSISNVQIINRNGKDYYILSLDYDFDKDISVDGSLSGKFSIHPSTQLVRSVSIGSSVIDVDSTIGFPSSGSLVVDLPNGTSVNINYGSKTYTQFLDCSGIDQSVEIGQFVRYDAYAYGYAGVGTNNQVKLRITGVLSDLQIRENSYLYDEGQTVKIKSLGASPNNIKSNNWLFNIASTYDVENIELINSSNNSYTITTYEDNDIAVGDRVVIILTDRTEVSATVFVSGINNKKSFSVKGQSPITINRVDKVRREVVKSNSVNYPEVSIYSSNVQNVYLESDADDQTVYVASPSIPNYFEQPLNIKDRSVTFSGTFSGTTLTIPGHGFYTGDAVVYRPSDANRTLGIEESTFFVKKINSDEISLARSKNNIDRNIFVSFSGTVTNDKLEYLDFSYQRLSSQKLIRKVSLPIVSTEVNETNPGSIGILVNGVEILNYKSKNSVFYGPIENIDVISAGNSYDVINPPILTVTDDQGSGFSGYCQVEGSIERIDILDGGFDYLETPSIVISGGGGSGAVAQADMVTFKHDVQFNSSAGAGLVDLTNNTIAFSTYHKFRDAEKVIYRTDNQTIISGLTTNSSYFVSVQDSFTVKLHEKYEDAIVGINTVVLSSYGEGNQRFESFSNKKKIGSISVSNSGSGYKNRKTTVTSSGINTSFNLINIKNHGYNTGEVIVYTSSTNSIGGLEDGKSYYVTKNDDDNFRVSEVGLGLTSKDFYFNTNQFVDLTSSGSGIHTFNYEPITVSVLGNIGVSTLTGQNFNAVLNPIARGEITDVFIENGGVSYGSSEILNYNRQPTFSLNSGSGAELLPIISNGRIEEVLVISPGSGYNSSPNLVIGGSGHSAILSPIVRDGRIHEIIVVNGGIGYSSSNTTVTVVSAGSGAEFNAKTKSWRINIVERLIQSQLITDDDGVIDNGLNNQYGLQYVHAYSPRKLRQTVLGTKYVNGVLTYQPDLRIINNVESNSDAHSPVIGWAYDGNPIYGPYAYDTPTGGSVRSMVSGYKLKLSSNRPPLSLYPQGFFVEDYEFDGSGDLDRYNGRFCITPEFPNGVYAYFTTINNGSVETTSPFKNYKKPVFPYFIGNEYKSKPIEFNFDRYSNQDDIDAGFKGWLRNTTPYNLNGQNSSYNYLINPNKIKEQNSKINFTARSGISTIGIFKGGENYKVSDIVSFNNDETEGFGAFARVSRILGKTVSDISVENSSVSNIEFTSSGIPGRYIGFSTEPHNLDNLDIISFGGLSTSIFNQKDFYTIGVGTDTFVLSDDVSNSSITGIVTFFNVFGSLNYPYIRTNDIFTINSEKIKVLNIDKESSRIRVLRSYGGSVGQGHTTSDVLYEDSRKFTFNAGIETGYSFNLNETLYFNPEESLGLGNSYGVGIGTTIVFSNPGVGNTQIFIPTKSLYFKDHQLKTGIEVIYSSGDGDPVSISTDGVTSSQLVDGQTLYVAKISDDLIGLSTERVGLGSTGSFVGINSSILTNTLFFTGIGTGVIHSLKTNLPNVLSGTSSKNLVTVSTSSTHGLSVGDNVTVSVLPGVTTTVHISYNNVLRKLTINPKNFLPGSVNTISNEITIQNHRLTTGQKVIHTSTSPSGGLETNKEYYVVVVDANKVKLSETYYNSRLDDPIVVDITSSSSGTLSLVNPKIDIYKNQTTIFDVSDSSLLYQSGLETYSAFEFDLFTDSSFKNKFLSTKTSINPEITKIGKVGRSGSYVELKINDNVPRNLFYNLIPVEDENNPENYKNIKNDEENIILNNTISIVESLFNGNHSVSGVTETTFEYSIRNLPERSSYSSSNSSITYTTDSTSALGPIDGIIIKNGGRNYNYLPGISSVFSDFGTGAILNPYTDSIGRIQNTSIDDIGFDYSADKTLRPVAKLPQILKIEPLSSFDRIGISSQGFGYVVAPDLIAIDTANNSVINDVILEYELNDSEVTIIKNTTGINKVNPKVLPINNSNGVGISTISYDDVSGDVTVVLNVGFSTLSAFPFVVGDKVAVENVSVGLKTDGKGYNSKDYNYQSFTINSIDPNIGGIGATVGYNLSQYLSGSEFPGNFDRFNSFGRIIPEKYFPIFDIRIKENDFFLGEKVSTNSSSGIIENYDFKNEYITVSSEKDFITGELLKGESSNTQGIISAILSPYAEYSVDSSSIVRHGWNLNTGFMNDSVQRMHDNDYYQYFSYSIKSKIEYEEWNNPVSNLNHTAGFKKFSDLIVESQDNTGTAGITTSQDQGDFIGLTDLISTVDLECVYDFDLATENTFNIANNIVSTEIVFGSKEIQDYLESIGNRVLLIDDISQYFNSNPRPTRFSIVDTFLLSDARYRKIFAYVRDKRFFNERQISVISLLHDGFNAYIGNYGRVETSYDMGYFDFVISGNEGNLLFYPTKYSINDFDISTVSHSISDTVIGTGKTSFGNIVYVNTSQTTLPSGLSGSQNIVSIGTSYRATKILLEINDANYYEVDEITVIHDGSNAEIIDYGQLTAELGSFSSTGIGTYSASISGGNLNIVFHPFNTLTQNYQVNTIEISGVTGSSFTTPSIVNLNDVNVGSAFTSIASSGSPTENVVVSLQSINESTSHIDAFYAIAFVEDKTNNDYQVSELLVIENNEKTFITEYGNLETSSGIGTFGANIVGSNLELYFTPIPNANVEVRIFLNTLSEIDPGSSQEQIDLNNAKIDTGYGSYTGTERDIRRDFQLTHAGKNIFRRVFDASSSTIVNVSENTIRIPNHYYVTGEEVTYTPQNGNGRIGIAETTVPGIGLTNILPSSLYIVKVNDLDVRVAASASQALSIVPDTLDLEILGIGTNHVFTSKNQNEKTLISIDNMIQSPIVASAITSSLLVDFTVIENTAYFTGVTSFFGGDLIKIGDEIMKIETVGFGSELGVLVQRPWMGTGISSHISGSVITKVNGNYNIVDNTINFYEAPFGPTPIGSITNPPDQRDYSGITTYSTFSGRTFLRSGVPGGLEETYKNNYIFDDISSGFNGITTQFTLKSNRNDISGISTNNAIVLIKDIFQEPQRTGLVDINGSYFLTENSGTTTISFTGDPSQTPNDINNSSIPVGGQIVSVGSTSGLGYQPLVSAGGTAVVSISGTIQSISIGNSGSGYRSGIQTVNVGVATTSLGNYDIEFVGVASVSNGNIVSVAITNPGTGYTSTEPPFVIFDAPLSYSNIPLIYSSSSASGGVGTEAKIDIIVGQGSSVIDFVINNTGYGYGQGEVLTVAIGGTVGIPTDPTKSFSEFKINLERTYSMEFGGMSIGRLQVFDKIESEFDGERVKFALRVDNVRFSIRTKTGSNVDIDSTLLVFINDILQVPKEAYFVSGSNIIFSEPPNEGDTCKIIFYRGTDEIDVIDVDVLETVKIGDSLQLNDTNVLYQQNKRTVTSIESTDIAGTNPYTKPGVNRDATYERPVEWCRQRNDKIVNGQFVGKDRAIYEPLINPSSYLIQPLTGGETEIYVDNIAPFFNATNENTLPSYRNSITIVSQDSKVGASATVLVSVGGTVFDLDIIDGGEGYITPPTITISQPPYATGFLQYTGGKVDSITYSERGRSYYSQEIVSYHSNLGYLIDELALNMTFIDLEGINFLGSYYNVLYVTKDGDIYFRYQTRFTFDRDYKSKPGPKINYYPIVGAAWSKFYITTTNEEFQFRVEGHNFGSSLSNTPYAIEISVDENALVKIAYVQTSFNLPGTIINDGKVVSEPWTSQQGTAYQIFTSDFNVVGFNTATVSALTTAGIITDFTITNAGTGYTSNPAPTILIEPPASLREVDKVTSYEGDHGVIVGFGTTTVGTTNKYIFDFYIPEDSYLRDSEIVGTATTLSGIGTGDYFVIRNSNVGLANTSQESLRTDNTLIGICTQFVDNVYQVYSKENTTINLTGIGVTSVIRVLANISTFNAAAFDSTLITFDTTLTTFDSYTGSLIPYAGTISTSRYFGEFSWGKIIVPARTTNNNFNFYGSNGVTGLTTSAMVIRTNPLKYINYL